MGWGEQQAATGAGQCDVADNAAAETPAHQPGSQRSEDVGASELLPADPRVVVPSPASEPETIHRSLTGGALTVLMDVLFSVFFISVMLFYSEPVISLFR